MSVDRLILNKVFERIDSLDELFAFKDAPSRWLEKMVGTAMRRETQRLRDACMQEMYARVTVNLNHLASRLIMRLLDRGITEIDRDRFHTLLYAAFKIMQRSRRSICIAAWPSLDAYTRHPRRQQPPIRRSFCETARASGLVEVDAATQYRFLPELRRKHSFHETRLENVFIVYANEMAPVAAACQVVDRAIATEPAFAARRGPGFCSTTSCAPMPPPRRPIRAPRHAAINGQETAIAKAASPS